MYWTAQSYVKLIRELALFSNRVFRPRTNDVPFQEIVPQHFFLLPRWKKSDPCARLRWTPILSMVESWTLSNEKNKLMRE